MALNKRSSIAHQQLKVAMGEVRDCREGKIIGIQWSMMICKCNQRRRDTREVSGMLVPAFFKGYIYWAGREPLRIYTPDGHPAPYIPTPNGTVQAIATD